MPMGRKYSNKEVEIKEEGSSWATYVEEFMKQSSRVSVCILSKSGDVWAHRGNFPSYCFAPLCGGPFKKGVTVKLSASAYYVEDVKVDIRGVTRVRFDRDSLVAFYTNICIIALCIEASESPNDDYANVGDPVTTNCESLANALAIYLQESDPPLIARVATPGFRPVTPGANMQAGREGWDALAASTITHKGDVTEYILCSTDCRSIYSSAGDVKFLSHEGPVTQEDGTEKVEVIDEAANMATALGTRVKPRQGVHPNPNPNPNPKSDLNPNP